jgi:cell division protease FtsH
MTKPYSEKTAELIDNEVKKMIDEAYVKTVQLLTDNRAALDTLAMTLLDKEVIFREDLEIIFGKRKWDKEEPIANQTSIVAPALSDDDSLVGENNTPIA